MSMDFKKLTQQARRVIDKRGGTESLKQDAQELKDIAAGKGTAKDKAKRAADAIKRPGAEPGAESASPTPPPQQPGAQP
jgi:hypothetical protein